MITPIDGDRGIITGTNAGIDDDRRMIVVAAASAAAVATESGSCRRSRSEEYE
jgi:hypothetical protein